jgi:membrane protein YqaA with SNARE-associated domain
VRRLVHRLEGRPVLLNSTLLASSYGGLPPLYAMALVCGAVRMHRAAFATVCLAGRFGRFYTLALVPEWFR